jgi:hypothetical protein
VLEPQPAVDQIGEQILDDNTVLGVTPTVTRPGPWSRQQ